jgi:hypothetical protein
MLVTSASKANKTFGLAEFRCGEADVASQFNGGGKPELRFAVGVADMNMHPTFLPREEVKTELTLTKDGG